MTRINQLPPVADVAGTDLFEIERADGSSARATATQIGATITARWLATENLLLDGNSRVVLPWPGLTPNYSVIVCSNASAIWQIYVRTVGTNEVTIGALNNVGGSLTGTAFQGYGIATLLPT